jgi:hypothetical protein
MTTNISADHRAAFDALTSGDYPNFALFSCFVNGEPAAAIVAVNGQYYGCRLAPAWHKDSPAPKRPVEFEAIQPATLSIRLTPFDRFPEITIKANLNAWYTLHER